MKILERISLLIRKIPKWVYWVLLMSLISWASYYEGYNHADNEDFDYEEARLDAPYWLEYFQSMGNYKLSDWNTLIFVAMDRKYYKNKSGGYTWCVLYKYKTIPNRKFVLLFPFYDEPDFQMITKPINTQHPKIKKILQYTRYPECNPSIRIYNEEPPAL